MKLKGHYFRSLLCVCALVVCGIPVEAQSVSTDDVLQSATWISDNDNGTFTNPLFYEEFSDPDMIRVGDDYYMTGTTMHTMPGLPVLHSKDMVNWELLGYAVERLDLGPAFRLEKGKDIYGQGIWAPCLRYRNGMFYIFSNVNHYNTQLFTATNPAGPWTRTSMKGSFHDLSVLFDDDNKAYVVWGYDELHMAQLNSQLTDTIPGTGRIIVPRGSGAGEGSHLYKINGKYYITNTNYDPVGYQVCLRADQPYGPYEVNVMSAQEGFGYGTGWRLNDTQNGPPFKLVPPSPNYQGAVALHQGGIIQVQSGEWWGWSMLDFNSVGRVTALSPVTWKEGWPYFGLSGNLTRTPMTWVKPNTGFTSRPKPLFDRSDNFDGPALNKIWQWNHVPDNEKWSLTEHPGYLRLHALPSDDFWHARNSLTQRAIGPESFAITNLDVAGLKAGDVAGLALLNLPYAWVGVVKENDNQYIRYYNQQTQKQEKLYFAGTNVWLRAYCNFDTDSARLSFSLDGHNFHNIGDPVVMPYQLKTFQGVRYALFCYSATKNGGYADFNSFRVDEPRGNALVRHIPLNRVIQLKSKADGTLLVNWKNCLRAVPGSSPLAAGNVSLFRVVDRGNGRVALQSVSTGGFVTVKGAAGMSEVRIEAGKSGDASVFQWEDMLKDDMRLLSLYSHRYLWSDPVAQSLCAADARGTRPDRKDGTCFVWNIVGHR